MGKVGEFHGVIGPGRLVGAMVGTDADGVGDGFAVWGVDGVTGCGELWCVGSSVWLLSSSGVAGGS